ncbi:hypothetical protein PENSPDRAFT_752712 [Peniophora sp. CONT]|nr:hypothetical protein PENSPDRAFT_752712 [Peniophora sp. CONT]
MSTITASAGISFDEIFDFDDADMTLRSISPFFADMMSLPQPAQNEGTRAAIDMAEDAASLRLLLLSSYPRTFTPEPKLENISEIKLAAAVARKFEVDCMLSHVDAALCQYASRNSEIAFAVAWKYELNPAIRVAARASLHHAPFLGDAWNTPEFQEVPATSLGHLYRYYNTAYDALHSLSDPETVINWITNDEMCIRQLGEPTCMDTKMILSIRVEGDPGVAQYGVLTWWWIFVVDVIATIRSGSRPTLDVAFDQALQKLLTEETACSMCRGVNAFTKVIQKTRQRLNEEIERRLLEVSLRAFP